MTDRIVRPMPMKRRTKSILVGIAIVVLLALVTMAVTMSGATARYRLTLYADSDGALVSGSSVNEVTYRKNAQVLGASATIQIDAWGEAVELDFGPKGKLFALLREGEDSRSGADWIVLRAFDFPGGAFPLPVEDGLKQVKGLTGVRELPLKSLPLLVRFDDINDPMTVRKVDPLNLEASFGPSARLTRATLEIVPAGIWPFSWYGITGEPLTNKIEKSLIWLKGLNGRPLDGGLTNSGAALGLSGGNFKRG